MPNSHRPPGTTRQCCLYRVRRCELSRPDRPTSPFCVGVRPAVALYRPTHSDAERTCRVVGPTHLTPPHQTRQDGLFVSCLVCRCDHCTEHVHTLIFLSATVLSCRESNSRRRSGRDTDKTVLSRRAWRCELALTSVPFSDVRGCCCDVCSKSVVCASDGVGFYHTNY